MVSLFSRHRGPEDWWSNNATIEDWFDEMVGEANILNKFSKIRLEEIRGMRAPFLNVGWNRQFLMMKEFGFQYDSSIIAPFSNPPFWPYTLDFKMPHNCSGKFLLSFDSSRRKIGLYMIFELDHSTISLEFYF